ncbi:MAG TPA: DUF4215 domain-containing protein [Nannocystis sp.]
MRWLAASLAVISAGCYRDLGVLECDSPSPPGHCVSAASETGPSSETSSSTSTQGQPDTSTGVASTSSSTGPDDSSESGTTSALDTGTSGAAPFCGDGTLDDDEECDDGNLVADDGCNALCKRDRQVFVSSEPGFFGGMLQGLKGADNYCVSRAAQAGFAHFLKFKAFLSDSKTDAVDRLFAGEGRYVLVDGTVVADNWQALLTEPLQHPIELTELGEVLHRAVWTGTRYGDGRAVPGSTHCDGWTSEDPDEQASFGISDEVDVNWTQSQYFNPGSCGSMYAIYCIEQQ